MTLGLLSPTDKNFEKYALEPMTRWLIQVAKNGTDIKYGEIKRRLESRSHFKNIFPPTRIGWPAGKLMENIREKFPDAPLLNVLLVRQDR